MKAALRQLLARLGRAKAKPAPELEAAEIDRTIADIRAARLSYCGPPKLENIAQALQQVRHDKVPGRYIEAGVALGGSAILLGLLKPERVALDLYDVFSMIPPPGDNDGDDAHQRYDVIRSGNSSGLGGDPYYGYVDGLIHQVEANLRRFGLEPEGGTIRLVAGLFEDTLNPAGPVALAHIDCDWYDSVKVCIERIAPRMSPGGIMIFDDYSSYSGCRRAVDEWLEQAVGMEKLFHRRSLGVRRAD